MKTLDEVIKALDNDCKKCGECPYVEEKHCRIEIGHDALHYLNEYLTTQTAYIKAMADIEDNPALDWDELKTMEGKPVWVEPACEWILISAVEEDRMYFIEKTCNEYSFYKEEMGKWQAYRKERE